MAASKSSRHAHGPSDVWERKDITAAIERERKRLARRLRELRNARQLTQEEAAEAAALHPKYLGRIEQAAANPSFPTLCALAVAYRVPVSHLFATRPIGAGSAPAPSRRGRRR